MKRNLNLLRKARNIAFERSGGYCEAVLRGCLGLASDVHHVKPRARGGSDNPKNLMTLCRPCHEKITKNSPGTSKFRTHSWQEEGKTENESTL